MGACYKAYVRYFNGRCNYASLLYKIVLTTNYVLPKYLYYILNGDIKNISETYQKGSCNKTLDYENLSKYHIPVPPIDVQQESVFTLDFITQSIADRTRTINDIRKVSNMCLKTHLGLSAVEMKKLGDICILKNGKNISKDELVDGIYPVIGGGKTPMGFHNTFNVAANTIIISKDGAYAGYVSIYNINTFITGHGIYVTDIIPIINNKYLFYYLSQVAQPKIYNLQTGMAQPGVNKDKISGNILIEVPPLDVQNVIVTQLDQNAALIAALEADIVRLKETAKNITDLAIKGISIKMDDPTPDDGVTTVNDE